MIAYLPEDKATYEERLERCNGAVVKNRHPQCCGWFMSYVGCSSPDWNPVDHYECGQCGAVVVQNDHEVCDNWETSDEWQLRVFTVDLVALKAA